MELAQKRLLRPFLSLKLKPLTISIVRRILFSLAALLLMWGFIRLAGYLVNLAFARNVNAPIMRIRKRLFRFFAINVIGAVAATAFFIVASGWIERIH